MCLCVKCSIYRSGSQNAPQHTIRCSTHEHIPPKIHWNPHFVYALWYFFFSLNTNGLMCSWMPIKSIIPEQRQTDFICKSVTKLNLLSKHIDKNDDKTNMPNVHIKYMTVWYVSINVGRVFCVFVCNSVIARADRQQPKNIATTEYSL